MELQEYNIVDALDALIDYRGRTPKKSEKGIPTLSAKSVKMGYIDYNQCYYISKEEYDSFMVRGFPQKGDILFTTEAPLGVVAKLDRDDVAVAQRLLTLRGKKGVLDNDFLLYYLQSSEGQQRIMAKQSGSTVMGIRQEEFRKINILIPSYEEQKKIASVLSALDDKIALNKKMNQKLEAMAKRLYDYWFVQYDFPDKNGHPYKTTGGPMTYNPTLKREIPEGWEVSNICPLMEILPGGTPSKAKPEYWNGDIPFFGPTDYCGDVFQLSTEEHITENGLNNCASALYPPKTIFITARGSVGKLIVCGKPMAMNQSCYALKPFDLEKYEYLFYLTKQLIEQLKKKGSGSVFKSINTLDIEQSFMSNAPNEIIELYCKKVKSIFERIKSNTVEIAKLTKLRDKLLPLLMNGQVTL